MLKIVGTDPDYRQPRARSADHNRKQAERCKRLRAAGMNPRGPAAESVTGGPDVVGQLVLIFNIATGRIEFAAPGALKPA